MSQDEFLQSLMDANENVSVFLISGIQLRGRIAGCDSNSVTLDSDGRSKQLVYKHAISTIGPEQRRQNSTKQR